MEAPPNDLVIADEDEKCGYIFYHKHSMLLKYLCLFCEKTYDNINYYCEHLSEHVYESNQIGEDAEHDIRANESSVDNLENATNQDFSCENECSLNAYDEPNVEDFGDATEHVKEPRIHDDLISSHETSVHLNVYTSEDQPTEDEAHNLQHENQDVIIGDTLITVMPIKEEAPTAGIDLSSMQFKCYSCKHNFPNLMCLKEHRCNQSVAKNPVIQKCRDCNELFNETSDLNKHILEVHHANDIICRFCGRSNFNSYEALQEHINAKHDNEEIFKCYICGRRYYLEANLLPHVWRHAKRVPQCCVVCGKITLRIQHHMKFKHSPRPTRLLQCSICNKTFSYTSSLSRHKLLHKLPRAEISKTVRIDHTNAKKRRKKEKRNSFNLNATAVAVESQAAVKNIL